MKPLVSIIMTVYNREKYLAEAVESVLLSDYPNFELIIADDCSADSSMAIAEEYAKKDVRVRIIKNKQNLGQFENRNHAAGFAKGTYLKYVDSDDKIYPDGISKLVEIMEQYPAAGIGMYYILDKNIPAFEMNGRDAIRKHFFQQQFLTVGPGGTILRTDFMKQMQGYPLAYQAAGDMYFNLKACCSSSVVLLPFEFYYYRVHGDQELNNPFGYLHTSFTYFRDAVSGLPLGLTEQEKKWFLKKNKRRFAVNSIKYFFSTGSLPKVLKAAKAADFSFKNFLEGIFQI